MQSQREQERDSIASAVLSILGFIFYGLYYYVKIKRGELFDFFHVYLVIVAVSFIGVILTAFMKKRTHQCVGMDGISSRTS